MRVPVQSADYFKDKVSDKIYKEIVELQKHLYDIYKLTLDSKQKEIDSKIGLVQKYRDYERIMKNKELDQERKRKHSLERLKTQESLKAFREFVRNRSKNGI